MIVKSISYIFIAVQRNFLFLSLIILPAHGLYVRPLTELYAEFLDGIPGIKREREILIGNLASGCQTGYKLLSLGQRGGLISAC